MLPRLRYALLIGAIALAGCRRGEAREVTNAFQWSDQIPAGATLHIRDLNGNVHVGPASGPTAQVTGSKKWRRGREDDVHFVANRVGNDVYVCAIWGKRGRCDEHGYTSNNGGSILRIFSLRSHSTDMTADLAVQLPPGVKLDVMTISGSTSVQGASSDVQVKTVNGSITAHNAAGALRLETVNGSITAGVDSLIGDAPLHFAAVNGSIHVELPASLQGDVTLATVTGRATSNFPLQSADGPASHSLRGTIGAGGRSVTLQTVNGAVELLRKG